VCGSTECDSLLMECRQVLDDVVQQERLCLGRRIFLIGALKLGHPGLCLMKNRLEVFSFHSYGFARIFRFVSLENAKCDWSMQPAGD
jgi:hypothetical protein